MPRPETEVERKMSETLLPDESPEQRRKPVVRARVVYLGAMRNKSVSLPGRILIDRFVDDAGPAEWDARSPEWAPDKPETHTFVRRRGFETREASEEGMSCYDFSTHDRKGDVIRGRLMPDRDDVPENVQSKPFVIVEHPDHLRWFYMARGGNGEREYAVLANQEDHGVLMAFIRRHQAGVESREALLKQVTE